MQFEGRGCPTDLGLSMTELRQRWNEKGHGPALIHPWTTRECESIEKIRGSEGYAKNSFLKPPCGSSLFNTRPPINTHVATEPSLWPRKRWHSLSNHYHSQSLPCHHRAVPSSSSKMKASERQQTNYCIPQPDHSSGDSTKAETGHRPPSLVTQRRRLTHTSYRAGQALDSHNTPERTEFKS